MDLHEALKWRYATKSMNGKTVPEEKLNNILEAIRFAPTSSGLQPFMVIVISDPELKEEIRKVADNQQQVVQSSHLLVFAPWSTYTPERIDEYINYSNSVRELPESATASFRDSLKSTFSKLTPEEHFNHAVKQTAIAMGFGLLAAAIEGVDASPMEGFNPKEVDKILGLDEMNLKSSTLMGLGFRNEGDDWLVNLKKVRRPQSEVFIKIR
jgi:nitroreductase/dihydropteridine reductase